MVGWIQLRLILGPSFYLRGALWPAYASQFLPYDV